VLSNVLEDGELENVQLVVLMGCNTGLPWSAGSQTLGDVLIDHGVDVVISVPGELNMSVASQWELYFWKWVTQEANLPMDSELAIDWGPHHLDFRGIPATIANVARAAALKALRRGQKVAPEDWTAMLNLQIKVSPENPHAADEFLYPARYGAGISVRERSLQ